jgi:hypothetical protein
MTVEITDVADTAPRRAIASFDPYEDAQALLDRFADGGFPVERLAIEGQDLEIVERITGRLDAGRAALAGGAPGALAGAAFGLLFGLWFTHDGASLGAIVLYWFAVGTLVGAGFEFFIFALSGAPGRPAVR